MLNELNQSIAAQIARLYCGENTLCQASLVLRLKNSFDDSQFESFLSTLRTKSYLIAEFTPIGNISGQNPKVKLKFKYLDVVKGESGEVILDIPISYFKNNMTVIDYNNLLHLFNPSLNYVSIYPNGKILFTNSDFGYEIAYTGTPVGGGTGGSGGDGGSETRTPAGTIYVPGENINPDPQTQTILQKQSSFDVNSLLIPGLLIAGIFLLKDKF